MKYLNFLLKRFYWKQCPMAHFSCTCSISNSMNRCQMTFLVNLVFWLFIIPYYLIHFIKHNCTWDNCLRTSSMSFKCLDTLSQYDGIRIGLLNDENIWIFKTLWIFEWIFHSPNEINFKKWSLTHPAPRATLPGWGSGARGYGSNYFIFR